MDVRQYLFEKDPYDGLDMTGHVYDIHKFSFPTSVLDLVKTLYPKLILEVGSWKGASAIHMADQLRDHAIPGHVVCIDTWLGAEEMWTKPMRDEAGRYPALKLVNGYPSFYYDFLKNVVHAGHQHRITPFPTTSVIGARVLAKLGVKADFIYIDGSHTYDDVMADLRGCWPLIGEGGVLAGDDFVPWWDVQKAVGDFSVEIGVPFQPFDDSGWLIRKV